MTLHLLRPAPAQVIDTATPPNVFQVQADLDNMTSALARHHGQQNADIMLAEAFARHFAERATRSGKVMALRFALEVALATALSREEQAAITPTNGSAA